MPSSRTISANGIEIFLLEQGEGPLVLLCHGWPELSYSWRHQIPALAAAGFHVVAPDMRGFGRTSAPADVKAYSIFDHVGDMVALVAALGEKQAVIVGHDWGAPVAWHAAMFRPDVIHSRRGPERSAAVSRPRPAARYLARKRHHQFLLAVFSDARRRRGRVRARCRLDDANPARARIFRSGRPRCSSKTARDFSAIREPIGRCRTGSAKPTSPISARPTGRSGFRGGLNWYRNIDRNWELTAPWQGAQIHQPSLFIAGSNEFGHHRPDRRQTGRRHGTGSAEPAAKAHHRRRRPLDAAGTRRRGQRGLDRFSQGDFRLASVYTIALFYFIYFIYILFIII